MLEATHPELWSVIILMKHNKNTGILENWQNGEIEYRNTEEIEEIPWKIHI